MHEVLVNRLGGLSLPRKSVVRLTDRPDMTLDVYRGRKTTLQQQQQNPFLTILRTKSRKQILMWKFQQKMCLSHKNSKTGGQTVLIQMRWLVMSCLTWIYTVANLTLLFFGIQWLNCCIMFSIKIIIAL